MLGITLLVFGLLCGASTSGAKLNDVLPEDQLHRFVSDVVFQAKRLLVTHRQLPDVNTQVNRVFLGVPIELALVTHNTSLEGPNDLVLNGNTYGEMRPTGFASVSTSLALGNLEVKYPYFLIDIFGFKEEGTAKMTLLDAQVSLELHMYKNILTSCQVTASVSAPTGGLTFTVGEQGSWMMSFLSVVEYILSKTVLPTNFLRWFFYPDIARHLEYVFEEAARTVSCS
uniref:Uncharacterized protein n=1 Tax=Riptortus pedestris TaxID=329032 RepID=R4WQ28_RIPPE|nr:unknown secreted protein [Riptortus pedestris]